jgi:hypothetical protein
MVRTHFSFFGNNPEEGKAYMRRPDVRIEVNAAFDAWTLPPIRFRRSSIPYLHYAAFWYYLTGDRVRLQYALALTNKEFSTTPWSMWGRAEVVYGRAREFAAGSAPQPKKRSGGLAGILRSFIGE